MFKHAVKTLATALGGFAIGYTIGALSSAVAQNHTDNHEMDDDAIRRIVRDEADKMQAECEERLRNDPHNITLNDTGDWRMTPPAGAQQDGDGDE